MVKFIVLVVCDDGSIEMKKVMEWPVLPREGEEIDPGTGSFHTIKSVGHDLKLEKLPRIEIEAANFEMRELEKLDGWTTQKL